MTRRVRSGSLAGLVLVGVLVVACGGGNPAAPVTPTAVPTAAPAPVPSPTPTPTVNCNPGGDCSGLTTPVARAKLKIYWSWDNKGTFFSPVPDPVKQVLAAPIPVGYSFLFDVTGRDKDDYETNGPGGDGHGIVWLPSDEKTMVLQASFGPWQQKYQAAEPGTFTMCAKFDDVYSNCLTVTVVSCAKAVPPYTCN
jgi:hypothetical protein